MVCLTPEYIAECERRQAEEARQLEVHLEALDKLTLEERVRLLEKQFFVASKQVDSLIVNNMTF